MLDRERGVRVLWLLVGAGGAVLGYLSRGALLGVAAPTGGVGLAWLALACSNQAQSVLPRPIAALVPSHPGDWRRWWSSRQRVPQNRLDAFVVGLASLVVGGIAAWAATLLLFDAPSLPEPQLLRALGFARLPAPAADATFDGPLRAVGHAVFPWSPFVVAALVTLVARGESDHRERAVCIVLVMVATTAYAAHALIAPYAETIPFVAPAALAGIVAVALDRFARDGRVSVTAAVGGLSIAASMAVDFERRPATAWASFGLDERAMGDVPRPVVGSTMATMGFALAAIWLVLSLDEDDREHGASWLDRWRRWIDEQRARCAAAWEAFQVAWGGNLAFGFLVLEAMLVGAAVTIAVGGRLGWASVRDLGLLAQSVGTHAWWFLPISLVLAPVMVLLLRAILRFVLALAGVRRATACALAGLVIGSVLSLDFYPALAAQLSPKCALEAFARLARADEPLGLLDVAPRVARYHAPVDEAEQLGGARAAATWLASSHEKRRWLLLRRKDLAVTNATWREIRGENLPIAEGGGEGGGILLATSDLGKHASENPLDRYLLTSEPTSLAHPSDARFGRELEALGWEVRDGAGRLVEELRPGRPYRLTLFFRVLAPMVRSYRAFIHIERDAARHNGDHEVLGGEYPMPLWRVGDRIADPHDLVLDPGMAPGWYVLYFGFFSAKEEQGHRLAVTRGRHDDNRVIAGWLRVK
jgi:hypothetical protein